MSFDGNIKDLNRMIESYIKNETKRKELEEQSKPEYIPSVKHVRFLTGKTYKIKARLLHPIHEKLGLDEDVFESYLEKRNEQDKNVK